MKVKCLCRVLKEKNGLKTADKIVGMQVRSKMLIYTSFNSLLQAGREEMGL